MAFRWQADDDPPILVFWSSPPPPHQLKIKKKQRCQSWGGPPLAKLSRSAHGQNIINNSIKVKQPVPLPRPNDWKTRRKKTISQNQDTKPADFFEINFYKKYFRSTIRVSNGLDPDQDRRSVGPDMGPNCFAKVYAHASSDDCHICGQCMLRHMRSLTRTFTARTHKQGM